MIKWLKNLDNEDKKVVYIYGVLGVVFVLSIIFVYMFETGVFKKIDIPENSVVYMWVVAGALTIAALIYAFRWALKTNQFDEDTKYQMFSEEDDNRFLRAHLEAEAKKEEAADKKAADHESADKK